MANSNPERCNKPMAAQIEFRKVGRSTRHVKIWMCKVCGKTRAIDADFLYQRLPEPKTES